MKGEKITRNCNHCGKEYVTLFKHSLYCSKICSHREIANRYYAKPKNAKCVICGSEFVTSKGFKTTCSQKCKKKSHSTSVKMDKQGINKCKFCGCEFLGKQKCCSSICEELYGRMEKEKEKTMKTKSESVTEFVKKIPKGMSYGTYVGLLEMGKETTK